jgi:hypothetical protein
MCVVMPLPDNAKEAVRAFAASSGVESRRADCCCPVRLLSAQVHRLILCLALGDHARQLFGCIHLTSRNTTCSKTYLLVRVHVMDLVAAAAYASEASACLTSLIHRELALRRIASGFQGALATRQAEGHARKTCPLTRTTPGSTPRCSAPACWRTTTTRRARVRRL